MLLRRQRPWRGSDAPVANVGHAEEELKRIELVLLARAALHVSLDLALALAPVADVVHLLLVRPEHRHPRRLGETGRIQSRLVQQVVQIDDLSMLLL